ncbi:AraC family transcriptional regulator, partial [Streptomyces anulatus]
MAAPATAAISQARWIRKLRREGGVYGDAEVEEAMDSASRAGSILTSVQMDQVRKDMAMTVFTRPGRHRVAVLAREVLLPIELGIVHQLFGQARQGASADGEPLYEVATCSLSPGDVRTDG